MDGEQKGSITLDKNISIKPKIKMKKIATEKNKTKSYNMAKWEQRKSSSAKAVQNRKQQQYIKNGGVNDVNIKDSPGEDKINHKSEIDRPKNNSANYLAQKLNSIQEQISKLNKGKPSKVVNVNIIRKGKNNKQNQRESNLKSTKMKHDETKHSKRGKSISTGLNHQLLCMSLSVTFAIVIML